MPGPNSHPPLGKTAFDRRNGVWSRHLANQAKRRDWNQKYASESKGGGRRVIPYPIIP